MDRRITTCVPFFSWYKMSYSWNGLWQMRSGLCTVMQSVNLLCVGHLKRCTNSKSEFHSMAILLSVCVCGVVVVVVGNCAENNLLGGLAIKPIHISAVFYCLQLDCDQSWSRRDPMSLISTVLLPIMITRGPMLPPSFVITIIGFRWDVLHCPLYPPDLEPTEYYLFPRLNNSFGEKILWWSSCCETSRPRSFANVGFISYLKDGKRSYVVV